MRAGYNMTGYVDFQIGIGDGKGTVGAACADKKPKIFDATVIRHEDRGVDSRLVWEDMKSILAVPILDSNEIPLGALSVDTDKRYFDAHFDDLHTQNMLMTLARGIGRLLEARIDERKPA